MGLAELESAQVSAHISLHFCKRHTFRRSTGGTRANEREEAKRSHRVPPQPGGIIGGRDAAKCLRDACSFEMDARRKHGR